MCPASTPLQMPQYLKIYAPGAGINKHKNIFVCIKKKYFYHHCCRKQACKHEASILKRLGNKKTERELQVHFLKHLIISKPSVVLEAQLMVFKLLRQSCKCGLYSHAGAALPALLPPCCSGRGKGKKKQIKTTQPGMALPSVPQVFAALLSSLEWIYSRYHIRKL